ncbi:hypothetical protein FQN54_005066 [Arachnomyces sp. PD_36]|nr:hypothetical protein FQN54_005066 [Arachnomyces sp. PD_36]
MAAQNIPALSSPDETEDMSATVSDSQFQQSFDDNESDQKKETSLETSPVSGSQAKQILPIQKRRRVTRACDECRRKKIKCDGKQPCTHCTVYSYECTYDQPSNRRRNPGPQYIEALESRLHKAEAIIQALLPDINLDDPRFDAHQTEQIIAASKKKKENQAPGPSKIISENKAQAGAPDSGEESMLESMVDHSGSLDLDDEGHWDYRGHSSGVLFMQRLRRQFGNLMVPEGRSPLAIARPISQVLESPKSVTESPLDSNLPPTHDLPSREVARKLCSNALDDACTIMRFTHQPTFYAMFDRIYDTSPEQFSNEENSFLPLLYVVLAVGCLFGTVDDSTLDLSGYESAIDQGVQYFKAGRQLLDVTDCRDLTSLQALCFMILFLQSSAKLSTCYSYVGIALRAALRLGLHRSVTANFNPLEIEMRKRMFWVVRKMDIYVSTLLGLPQLLSEDDIDQEFPLAIDDECVGPGGISPMPPGSTSLMAGANAHGELLNILVKVVKYIYPVKHVKLGPNSDHTYVVSHSKIREIERDLQTWMEALPSALKPGEESTPEVERMRQLLRISYAHVQMVMYRPFLHYVAGGCQGRGIDKRSYACAAACVSVARNVVHITAGMKKRKLLNGSYWFTMYTTYFAILSLVFFVLENPESPTVKDGILKDALEGKNTLAGLTKKSLAADRCTQSLNGLFKHLPEKLRNRQSSTTPFVNRKRAPPSPAPTKTDGTRTPPTPAKSAEPHFSVPLRASTFPTHASRPGPTQPVLKPERTASSVSSDDSPKPSHLHPWSTSDPSPLNKAESVSSMSPVVGDRQMPSSSSSVSSQQQQNQTKQQQIPFSHSFENPNHLPDLTPVMFPSGDPFAYPNQPMSTLEDDHFKHDNLGVGSSSSPQISTPVESSLPNQAAFNNASMFPGGSSNNGASMNFPNYQNVNRQSSGRSTHMRTPSSGNEAIRNPDLVSMPNQTLSWQGLSGLQSHPQFTNTTIAPPQPSSSQTGMQQSGLQNLGPEMSLGIGDFGDMGMGMSMGMGMNLDEIFGSSANMGDDWAGGDWMDMGTGEGNDQKWM